jgi:hypothetical protein
LGEGNSMFFEPLFGRSRAKQIAALLGKAAAALMLASPIAVNGSGLTLRAVPQVKAPHR